SRHAARGWRGPLRLACRGEHHCLAFELEPFTAPVALCATGVIFVGTEHVGDNAAARADYLPADASAGAGASCSQPSDDASTNAGSMPISRSDICTIESAAASNRAFET